MDRNRLRIGASLLAGLMVFALLFFWGGGVDTQPPTCWGMFGRWTVPCEGWAALTAGALTSVVVWSALWSWDRRGSAIA
jgi:hypothetical protein